MTPSQIESSAPEFNACLEYREGSIIWFGEIKLEGKRINIAEEPGTSDAWKVHVRYVNDYQPLVTI